MTDTTREAVARAMFERMYSDPLATIFLSWENLGEEVRHTWRNLADAALAALRPAQDAEGWVLVQREVVEFLRGAAPLDGVWFGDKHWEKPGAFWWRSHLPSPPRTLEGK